MISFNWNRTREQQLFVAIRTNVTFRTNVCCAHFFENWHRQYLNKKKIISGIKSSIVLTDKNCSPLTNKVLQTKYKFYCNIVLSSLTWLGAATLDNDNWNQTSDSSSSFLRYNALFILTYFVNVLLAFWYWAWCLQFIIPSLLTSLRTGPSTRVTVLCVCAIRDKRLQMPF